jgi:DNA-directed RNA polymerase specialized sigma24 family protein
MEDLIKLVRTYRVTTGLAERNRFGDAIFAVVEPELSRFVRAAIRPSHADDVLQEALKAVVTSLPTFSGRTTDEFLAWCRGVARHKILNQYSAFKKDRFQPLPPDEILELVSLSVEVTPLATGERLDLDYAMDLLATARPDCVEHLWDRFAFSFELGEIAEKHGLSYDAARMQVGRCLETAREIANQLCQTNEKTPNPRFKN